MDDKMAAACTALMQIATGGIVGEPNNHRDTVAAMRGIALDALVAIDPANAALATNGKIVVGERRPLVFHAKA